VSVNFLSNFNGSQLCVSGRTSCGFTGASRCFAISSIPSLPGIVSGAQYICPGSTGNSYTIAPVSGAVSYVWSVTGSGLTVAGSGTSATVATSSTFTAGSVCVSSVNSCGVQSSVRCKSVNTGKVGTPSSISGDPLSGVCGGSFVYTVPTLSLANSYTWTIPSGVSVVGSSTSNSISLRFPSNFTSGQLCVRGNNSCGAGFDRCAMVYGNPATPASISGPSGVCSGASVVYTWPTVSGATQYQLTVPAGAVVVGGSTTSSNSATVIWGTTGGNVIVKSQNNCGVSGSRTYAVTVSACRLAENSMDDFQTTVFPNPAHSQIQLKFETMAEELMMLDITDFSGRAVKNLSIVSNIGENYHEIDISSLSPGLYYLSIRGEKAGQSIKTIVIQ
jgi:hypothetical protein